MPDEVIPRTGRMPRPMLEKLTEHYFRAMMLSGANGEVGGHAIGFYKDVDEDIKDYYKFPQGYFTLSTITRDFYWWGFDRYDKS